MQFLAKRRLTRGLLAAACTAGLWCIGLPASAAPQQAPQGVQVPALSCDHDSALLVWQRPATGDDVAFYNVYANGQLIGNTQDMNATKTGDKAKEFINANQALVGDLLLRHSYEAKGLTAGTQYNFTVRAVGQDGKESADSQPVQVTTLAAPTVVKLTDFGGVGDGTTVNTAALQKAIDATPAGGVLEIPAGTFVSGAVQLKSNMTLQLDKDAVLLESANPADLTMGTNGRYIGMLNAKGVDNIRIVGEGIVDGNGWQTDAKGYYLKAKNKENKGLRNEMHVLNIGIGAKEQTQAQLDAGLAFKKAYNARSTTVIFQKGKNIYLEGVTFRNPAMHMLTMDCDNVVLNNVNVETYNANNGDGIDYCGKGLLVVNSFFNTGDDAINFSAGMGKKAESQPPVSDIWIFNNVVEHGHGGIVLGSHTGSWIQNLLGEDNIFHHTDISLRCKTGSGVGGGGRNVTFRHNVAQDMKKQGFIFTTAYTDVNAVGSFIPGAPGVFHDITVEDCVVDGTKKAAIEINGDASAHHHDIHFKNVKFTNTHENIENNCDNITYDGVTYQYAEK